MGRDRLRVEVLGPIRVLDAAGRDATPDGPLQRRLLALLVLRRGRAVSVDGAIDMLWPDRPPRDPVAALQNQVFRLRRRLPSGLIESVGDGYRLDPALIEVDADLLADLLAAGTPGTDDSAVVEEIDAVLDRWQGPAYPELADIDDGRVESERLGELRVRAAEARAEHRLAAGDSTGSVAELAALADAEPLRERPRALLMTALARSGRHAEALRVYDDFRRLLGEELGIEPSPSLVALQADVLAGSGAASSARVSRLPVPATSLVGRDALVGSLTGLVGAHRVVTLVGPGGVGKTRLAIEIGHRLQAARADRPVALCELAATGADDGPDAVAEAVASSLGVDPRHGTSTVDRLVGVLGTSDAVVVLDNCEHVVVPVAGLVERLVAACPNVTVVATSRERLRVDGEHVYTVPALPVGDGDGPAVELFVQRARAVSPEFAPDAGEQAGIAEIVRRLDGLPLAIELAAARLHTHDVAEVAAGLDERFSLLSSGSRTSIRHGSLRAAVAWSFGLLDERLRRTFAELSVFAGSFTAADAAAVCETDAASATEALTQLTERSLVLRAPGRRYVLLETLRAFGAEQLTASGDAEAAGHRHARHQVDWIEDADRRMFDDDGAGVIGEITAAVGELRAALGWLLEHGQSELASRLVVALLDYGLLGQRPDVLAWARRVAEVGVPEDGQLAGRVWCVAAYAAWLSGDGAGTAACTERALAAAERSGTIPSEVATIRGNVELFEGRLDEAVGWYGRATEAAVAAGDLSQHLLSRSTGLLARAYADDPAASELADQVLAELGDAVSPMAAYVWHCAGEVELRTDPDRARNRFTRATELAERTGASLVTGLAGASRASIDARVGDPRMAAADYKRLIADWRRAGVWSTQWTMLRWVAVVLARLDRPRDAAVLEGAVRATTAGHRIFGADEVALAELGQRLRAELGDEGYEEAVREGSVLDGAAAVEHALRAL